MSIVIPARDAAETLAETLESVLAQTVRGWEAIVVDDSSVDQTVSVAEGYAARDSRIRVIPGGCFGGAAAARNEAIRHARYDWLAFLDADDWYAPNFLESLTGALLPRLDYDFAYCGWSRVGVDGRGFNESPWYRADDMFTAYAGNCVTCTHTIVVRRSLVEEVGLFDTDLKTCEDWDLWLRLARAGARFARVPEILSYYRMRPRSLSADGRQLLEDGLRVIALGHAADPRVRNPHPAYAAGLPRSELPHKLAAAVGWCAGLEIGSGRDAVELLGAYEGRELDGFEPSVVAGGLFKAVPLAAGLTPASWFDLWAAAEEPIDAFLLALEAWSGQPVHARARRVLEQAIVGWPRAPHPCRVGSTQGVCLELSRPFTEVELGVGVSRLVCTVELGGRYVGLVELAVEGDRVETQLLADAVASQLSEQVLREYFRQTLLPDLEVQSAADGRLRLFRGSVLLAEGLPPNRDTFFRAAYDFAGWHLFAQELWGRQDWEAGRLYDPELSELGSAPRLQVAGTCTVEVSAPLPRLKTESAEIAVTVTAGGAPAGLVVVPAVRGSVTPQELRAAIGGALREELCRVVVREAVLGRPIEPPTGLRDRLAAAILAGRGNGSSLPPLRRLGQTLVYPRRGGPLPLAGVVPITRVNGSAPCVSHGSDGNGHPQARTAGLDLLRARGGLELSLRAAFRTRLPACGSIRQDAPFGRRQARHVPILMYHRVSAAGAASRARYRVAPDLFERHLRALRDAGYHSLSLDELVTGIASRQPVRGKPVLLTFDDGYADFPDNAWPLLRTYGFRAAVFLVADLIGGMSTWDEAQGEAVDLMDWDAIRRLGREGVEFGSHSCTHPSLTVVPTRDLADELARSRRLLAEGLGRSVDSIAYPYGDVDGAVRHLADACGYAVGFTCRPEAARTHEDLLLLPRLEVKGDTSPEQLARMLSPRPDPLGYLGPAPAQVGDSAEVGT